MTSVWVQQGPMRASSWKWEGGRAFFSPLPSLPVKEATPPAPPPARWTHCGPSFCQMTRSCTQVMPAPSLVPPAWSSGGFLLQLTPWLPHCPLLGVSAVPSPTQPIPGTEVYQLQMLRVGPVLTRWTNVSWMNIPDRNGRYHLSVLFSLQRSESGKKLVWTERNHVVDKETFQWKSSSRLPATASPGQRHWEPARACEHLCYTHLTHGVVL